MSGHDRVIYHAKSSSSELKHSHQPKEPVRPKEFALTAGLLTSLCTLPLCLPYYLVLIEESFESVNKIAMDLDDEGSLRRLLLLNVVLVVKFLATLLPIPLAAAFAGLAPRGWKWIVQALKPEWQKIAPATALRRLFSVQHLACVVEISGKCAIILILLYLEILHDLAGFLGQQGHTLKQPIFYGLQQWYALIRMMVFILLLLALMRWRR